MEIKLSNPSIIFKLFISHLNDVIQYCTNVINSINYNNVDINILNISKFDRKCSRIIPNSKLNICFDLIESNCNIDKDDVIGSCYENGYQVQCVLDDL